MKYRPEIDGLRALAVIPVILFHAGFQKFSGGFIGVDIFFVISGYLITTIIVSDLDAGKFSIATFYERRARRILPALFVVLCACLPFAWLWLPSEEVKSFGQSMSAVSLFVSNIFFWRQSGYFDTVAELKPLLHTWSLAVEEQYYLFFPLFLLVSWRLGKRRVIEVLTVMAVLSLVAGHWAALTKPNMAFFLPVTRAWELLLGSLVAFNIYRFRWPTQKKWIAEVAGLAGVVSIVYAIFNFDKGTPVPGLPLLIPTLGAATIIVFARSDTLVGRILASGPMVGVGLISYSAYLWHQPLLVFARHRSIEQLSGASLSALCLATLLLAYLTWRLVEQPFRSKQIAPTRRGIYKAAFFGSVAVLIAGTGLALQSRDDPERVATLGPCSGTTKQCYVLPNAIYQVALWGDSYAGAMAKSLGEELNRHEISLHVFTKDSCPSLLGTVRNEPARLGVAFAKECEKHNEQALASIRALKIDAVLLAGAYQWYFTAKNNRDEPILLNKENVGESPQQWASPRLSKTVQVLNSGRAKVMMISPYPILADFNKARKQLRFGSVEQVYAEYDAATQARNLLLTDSSPKFPDLIEIDGRELLCERRICPIATHEGNLLLYDGSHMGGTLATRVARKVTDVVLRIRDSTASTERLVATGASK